MKSNFLLILLSIFIFFFSTHSQSVTTLDFFLRTYSLNSNCSFDLVEFETENLKWNVPPPEQFRSSTVGNFSFTMDGLIKKDQQFSSKIKYSLMNEGSLQNFTKISISFFAQEENYVFSPLDIKCSLVSSNPNMICNYISGMGIFMICDPTVVENFIFCPKNSKK